MMSLVRTPSVLRRLAREPGYAAAFVLTLGLGIGATTAIYSAVQGVLLRPLPYPHAHRIACAVVLLIAAGIATCVPARRATRVEPTVALRAE